MGLVRRATVTAALEPTAFAEQLERCVDAPPARFSFGSRFERRRPYVGRVESDGFTLRKRTGQPWDHFSPLVHGSLHRIGEDLKIEYQLSKITRVWVLGRLFVVLATIGLLAVAAHVALEFRDGAELMPLLPLLMLAGALAVAAIGMLVVIRQGAVAAANDSAELDLLIRNAVRDAERRHEAPSAAGGFG